VIYSRHIKEDGMRLRTRTAGVVAMAWMAAAASASAGVKGSFINGGLEYPVVDGVAYERKAEFGDGMAVRLALSMKPMNAAALDAALDLQSAIGEQRGGSPFVDLEFRADGLYTGTSYYLASGNGCGWCSDPKAGAKSQVTIVNGVLRGTMKITKADYSDGDGPAITLTVDTPVRKVAATALPADGGDAGKVLLACRRFALAKDAAGAKAGCFARDDKLAANAWEAEPEAFWSIALMYERDSLQIPALKVTGGRMKGDWAEVQVEGKDSNDNAKKGSVFFHKTPAGWRFHHEKLETIY
jgi:hypothetical protein